MALLIAAPLGLFGLFGPPPAAVDAPPPGPAASACVGVWDAEVVDADTGEGVPNALVKLQPPRRSGALYARTDDHGRLHLEGLCAGRAEAWVTKPEHLAESRAVELTSGVTTTTIELVPLHAHHDHRVVIVHDETQSNVEASEHLSGADLAETRGEGLGDAISGMAGVTTLRGTAGGMAKPVIRGQLGRRNLIIFDGVPHAGQKWGLDHAPEVDPYAAGRISVIKGAATTRFGPDAIGGVVLVDPRPLPRAAGVTGEVSTMGSSNALGGGGAFRLDHAPARLPGFAWRAEGNFAQHRAALAPDYPLDNTGAQTWNAGARTGYLTDAVDVEAGYRLMRARAGICSCLRLSTTDEFADAIARARPPGADLFSPEFQIERPRQEIWHHLALARTRVQTGKAGELHASYAYQFNDRKEFDIVRDSISGPQLTLGLATHNAEGRWEHAAVDLGRDWALVGTVGAHVTQQANELDASITLIPDYLQWSGGPFVVERFVHDRLEVEVGARYEGLGRTAFLQERDFLGQSAGGRLDEGACSATGDGGAECRKTHHAPSVAAGILARPVARAPEFTMRVEANSSARVPAIDEQYMNGAAPSFPILGLGNSNLGIERTWGGTTTLQYDGDWFFAEGSGYANFIDDYIYFRPTPQEGQCAPLTCTARGPLPVFAFDPINALFGGGEVRLSLVAPNLPFEVSGTGSWVRATDLTNDGFVTFVPPDRYSLLGRYLWPDTKVSARGYLEINGTVVDKQRRFDREADFADPPPAYVLLGAAAGVEFPADDHRMRLSARGSNLLNRRYREYTSLLRYFADQPGWSVQLRFSVDFNLSPSTARHG